MSLQISRQSQTFLRRFSYYALALWRAMGELGKAHCVDDPSTPTPFSPPARARDRAGDPD